MKNKTINIGILKDVATALDELNEQVVYVGGAVVGIYADDPAAEDVRPTKDVDFTLKIASYTELTKLEEELNKKGFNRNPEEKVECRFFLDRIMVDVMSTTSVGWAPANSWFKPGFDNAEEFNLEGIAIRILPLPYYLATKLEAYHGRGNDPRTSHDFEDVIYVLDNRVNLIEEIIASPDDVKTFLHSELKQIKEDAGLQEAMLGHLYPETQSERQIIINNKLQEIIDGIVV